mmetsp:Transcript_119906/g.339892  ORF Transcript_119906/g.339892 Transcript_119906/m.339892 type:complete len:476 (+) Transcript_119906:207-1634(+)
MAVSEEEILQLVSEREALRQARRFPESDAIREQLRGMGVELYDKEREWRCRDGRRGVLFTAGAIHCQLNDSDIHEIIVQREDARTGKDWGQADRLRDDLRRQGVELDDRIRTWRTASGRSGTYSGQSTQSAAMLTEAEIRSMVAERERSRAAQDFATADELRRRLLRLGVELFDSERTWRANDGRQGVIVTGGIEIVQCTLYDSEINARIEARELARAQKDWERADAERDDLRRLGVELMDSEQKWRTTDGRTGVYSPQAVQTAMHTAMQPQQWAPGTSANTGANFNGSDANGIVQAAQTIVKLQEQLAATGGTQSSAEAYSVAAAALQAYLTATQAQAAQRERDVAIANANAIAGALAAPPLMAPQLMAPPPAANGGAMFDALALLPAPLGQAPAPAPLVGALSASVLSDASIQALVAGREAVREGHDYAGADGIREDLRRHGVEVWDKQRAWRAEDGRQGSIAAPASRPFFPG